MSTLFDSIFKPLFGLPVNSPSLPDQIKKNTNPSPVQTIKSLNIESEENNMSTAQQIAAMKAKVQSARNLQQSQHANEGIKEHIGEQMVVVGMKISEDIEIKSAGLIMDKVTFNLADGTSLDGWHQAAVENAKSLIDGDTEHNIPGLGEGPYDPPLLMTIESSETKRGITVWVELIDIYDPEGKYASIEAEAHLDDILQETPKQPSQPVPAQDIPTNQPAGQNN